MPFPPSPSLSNKLSASSRPLASILALCLFGSCISAIEAQETARAIVPGNQAVNGGIAVLAGIDHYQDFSGFPPLKYALSDVDALASALERLHYTVLRIKESPTRQPVLSAVKNAASLASARNAPMIFFFSGHGFAVDGVNYLALHESDASDLRKTGLAVREIEEAMMESGVRQRILLIDACRSEANKRSLSYSMAEFKAEVGTKTLFSTKAGGLSYEKDELRHGVFTYYLLSALTGAAADERRQITFNALAKYVSIGVHEYSLNHAAEMTPAQIPAVSFSGEVTFDFLIGTTEGLVPTMRLKPIR